MPVEFSPELCDEVCAHIAEGKSLRQIARLEGMPSTSAVIKWLLEGEAYNNAGVTDHPKAQFVAQYARARTIQADTLFEQTLDIADDKEADMFFDEDGKQVVNFDHIQRARLRVDTRKWMVGKLAPKKYGEKTTTAIEGGDPDKPIKTDVSVDPSVLAEAMKRFKESL